jgi:hypothetical protein
MVSVVARLVLLPLLALVGCRQSAPPTPEPIAPNMGQITMLYMQYLRSHNGMGPRNAEDFKRFIRTDGAAEARRLEVDLSRPDELFTSPRDQQPIIINFGLRLGDTSQALPIVAYEARGRDGKRMVAFMNGMIKEVDAQQAADLGLKTD